ncbi:O-antigen ligase family protein [Myxococcota bacterium]|nr:O-antigen ligase family protein [Myxococcota bacterium]
MNKKGRPAEAALEPISGGLVELLLVLGAVVTVAFVAFWFQLDVNRVFDVPKALALKVGGGGIFLVWLLWASFGPGVRWRSIRVFAGPVAALTGAMIVSTLLSLDRPMSLYGVYERQFGLQGFLGCVGLFVVTATGLRSRRGAIAALSTLMLVGGVLGAYSLLQRTGQDPFGFFQKPHNKVYSLLGNATFAGNALALLFPMSLILAIVAAAKTLFSPPAPGEAADGSNGLAFIAGIVLTLGLQLLPGWATRGEGIFKLSVGVSLALAVAAGLAGTWGPEWARFSSPESRRSADAYGAGALAAAAIAIAIGLVCTRTRGAWVGTFVAISGGLVLLPFLFKDDAARFKKMVTVGVGGLVGLLALGGLLMLAFPNHLYSQTIKSIPYAFSPEHTVYGKGQGTRPYLWAESPRVLVNHDATITRKQRDLSEYAEKVKPDAIDGISLRPEKLSEGDKSFERTWRTIAVWPFGIGIETYRYAFMSHKSKKLEALDPMTNHDNPHNNYLYVLASLGLVGLGAYLWLLWRLLSVSASRFAGWRPHPLAPPETDGPGGVESREARAIAFGVLTSFFSYAFYSIAGFDSVACSVFFYFFLGCAAVYFAPSKDERPLPLVVHLKRRWAELRGRDSSIVPVEAPVLTTVALVVVLGGLLANTVYGGLKVYRAERAFIGDEDARRDKIENIKRAIAINPDESHYKQTLGSTYAELARRSLALAQQAQNAGKIAEANNYESRAEGFARQGEAALYAALDHAWAPENVFISLFQLHYTLNELDKAEYALERALEHSPHLGAVRANLAILKLERKAYGEALRDCEWVLEVDPASAIGLRTCGRAKFLLGDLTEAERLLKKAASLSPKDSVAKNYLRDLDRAKQKAATATATAPSPTAPSPG